MSRMWSLQFERHLSSTSTLFFSASKLTLLKNSSTAGDVATILLLNFPYPVQDVRLSCLNVLPLSPHRIEYFQHLLIELEVGRPYDVKCLLAHAIEFGVG